MKYQKIITISLAASLLFAGCSSNNENIANTAETIKENPATVQTEDNTYSNLENYITEKQAELREDHDFDISFHDNTFHITYTEMEMKNTDGKGYEAVYIHTANFEYTIGDKIGKYRYHNEQNVYQHGNKIVSNSFAFNADIYVNDYPNQSSVQVTKYDNVTEEASANILASGGNTFNHMMELWHELCLGPNHVSFKDIGFLLY